MSRIERKSQKQLNAEGWIPVAPLTPGAKPKTTDDWDTENLTPAAEDPRLINEYKELKKRAQDHRASNRVKEAVHEVRESNESSAAHRAAMWEDQEELVQYRPGRILHKNKFLRMLRTILPSAEYALYGTLGLLELRYRPHKGKGPVHLSTVQNGYMIEWTQMRTDEHGLPSTQRFRGWRSVLLDLLHKRVISETDVLRTFGPPRGPRAAIWGRKLYALRNNKCLDCGSDFCTCKNFGESLRADAYQYR